MHDSHAAVPQQLTTQLASMQHWPKPQTRSYAGSQLGKQVGWYEVLVALTQVRANSTETEANKGSHEVVAAAATATQITWGEAGAGSKQETTPC